MIKKLQGRALIYAEVPIKSALSLGPRSLRNSLQQFPLRQTASMECSAHHHLREVDHFFSMHLFSRARINESFAHSKTALKSRKGLSCKDITTRLLQGFVTTQRRKFLLISFPIRLQLVHSWLFLSFFNARKKYRNKRRAQDLQCTDNAI